MTRAGKRKERKIKGWVISDGASIEGYSFCATRVEAIASVESEYGESWEVLVEEYGFKPVKGIFTYEVKQ